MDRPEGTEVSSKTNKVYVMLTNNTRRKAEDRQSLGRERLRPHHRDDAGRRRPTRLVYVGLQKGSRGTDAGVVDQDGDPLV
jgi:secreted PhoX family phosphatase